MIRTSFIFFSFLLIFLEASEWECQMEYTDIPPFYISGVTKVNRDAFKQGVLVGNDTVMTTENFREINKGNAPTKRISRGTVVKLDTIDNEDYAKAIKNNKKGFFVEVMVLSTHSTYTQFKSAEEKKRFVQKGDTGRLWSQSMKPANSDYTYIVTEDTNLMVSDQKVNIKGIGLKPIIENDQYKIYKCCHTKTQKCQIQYLFKCMVPENHPCFQNDLRVTRNQCGDFGLRAAKNSDFTKLNQLKDIANTMKRSDEEAFLLSDLEVNDWGYARLPLHQETNSKNISGVGPGGYYVHYQGNDPTHSDSWGKITTICSIMKVAKAFKEECLKRKGSSAHARCTLQIGDIAFATPAENGKGRDLLGHASHSKGECVDMRFLRKDNLLEPTIYDGTHYDRELTQLFIDIAKKHGAVNMLTNDPKLKGVKAKPQHDFHIHYCFPTSSETVQKNCS